MKIKEKIIQIWLTIILAFLGFSRTLIIVPFILSIKIKSHFLVDLIELIFKPVDFIILLLTFITALAGPLFFLFAFLTVAIAFVLIIIESYLLAGLIIFLIKKILPENFSGSFNYRNRFSINNKIENRGNIKNYLPIILQIIVFVILFAILYPIVMNLVGKEDKKESQNKNESTLLEQANKIDENIDSDSDGLNDKIEFIIGTDRYFVDTDRDGFSDFDELKNGYNPLIISSNNKLNENAGNLSKEILLNVSNVEFSKLNSLRTELENQISNELCKNSPHSDIDLSDKKKYKEAIKVKDPCICSKISDEKYKINCYIALASSINNESLCNYILEGALNAQEAKKKCFHSLMLVNLDEKYCYRIKEGKDQAGCVFMLSLKTKKYNLCDGIKNLDERDYCHYNVAVFSKNTGLCDKISPNNTSGNDRKACRSMIEKSPFPAIR